MFGITAGVSLDATQDYSYSRIVLAKTKRSVAPEYLAVFVIYLRGNHPPLAADQISSTFPLVPDGDDHFRDLKAKLDQLLSSALGLLLAPAFRLPKAKATVLRWGAKMRTWPTNHPERAVLVVAAFFAILSCYMPKDGIRGSPV